MKKKPYVKAVVATFVAIYIITMMLATVLEKKSEEHETFQFREMTLENINSGMDAMFIESWNDKSFTEEAANGYMLKVLMDAEEWSDDTSRKYSVAIYKETGEKVSQAKNILEIGDGDIYVFELDDYFDEEEQAFLKQVFLDREAGKRGISEGEKSPPYWRIHAYVNEETRELAKLYFTTEYGWAVDEADYETPNTETKWSWINPDESVHENLIPLGKYIHVNYEIRMPYLRQNEKEHETWMNHEFLQEFPETWTDYTWGERENETLKEKQYEYVTIHYIGSSGYIFMYREISEPWIQAMESLKSLYICSSIVIMACVLLIIHNLNAYNKKREILESTRRDFTNAIAHELKTPLGIIRGFAENILENVNETKKDYYLKQIVGQTEEMDKLVKEMVYISKLDSVEDGLEKERVIVENVVKEQLKKLDALIDEKNLEIKLKVNNNLEIWGDKKYLERAIGNLLLNAIEYNHLDGFIKITIDKAQFKIENSGVKIGEDEMPHVFDMFYTSDKSRNFSDKHMGLGLYLAKKIFELHKMNIVVANTEVGVEAKVTM